MNPYIVIGGGILGASTAFHLAKSGVSVTLIDQHHQGQATDAAAGIICPWVSQRRNKAWFELAIRGARYYPDLVLQLEEIGETNTGYKKVGALQLAGTEEKIEATIERTMSRKQIAPEIGEVKKLSQEQTKERFPPLSDEFFSALIGGGARVNGRSIRQALINGAIHYGAKVLQGEATLFKRTETNIQVSVDGKKIDGEKVLITAGAWAKSLLKQIDIEVLVEPQKAQIIHLELPTNDTDEWPVVLPPGNHYLLGFEQGRVIVGTTHEDNCGFDASVTAKGQYEILERCLSVAPGLAESKVIETRVGFRPVVPGFLPVLGRLPFFNHLYVANGLGSSGLTVGPYLGKELAKLAQGEPTELDLSDYQIDHIIKSEKKSDD